VGGLQRLAYQYVKIAWPSEIRFYQQQLNDARAQVVHCHFGTDARYFLAAMKSSRVPVFISYYGYDVSSFVHAYWGLGRRYLASLWRLPALHLAMTPAMATDLEALGAPTDRIRVHHHGVDTAFWGVDGKPGYPYRPYVLQVGSLQKKKGHEDLIRAFALVHRAFPEVDLRLVGSGPQESTLRGLVRELGVEARVAFVGRLPHGEALRAEYSNALLFCHPSRTAPDGDREGLPGTILEAMASGRAVVATRHAGIPFAVRDAETGWLVEEGDVQSLAIALEDALGSAQRRAVFGAAGQALVRAEFDVQVQAGRLEGLYDEAVAARL
jgi:colanic acid/amylovoran biosynthesis glycosyltransferase